MECGWPLSGLLHTARPVVWPCMGSVQERIRGEGKDPQGVVGEGSGDWYKQVR